MTWTTYGVNPVQLKSDLGPAQTPYQMRTHMLGSILSWAADNPVYREHIALYKNRQRPILRGANVYHILPMADGVNWDGLQYFNPDLNRGSVFLFKPSANVLPTPSRYAIFFINSRAASRLPHFRSTPSRSSLVMIPCS